MPWFRSRQVDRGGVRLHVFDDGPPDAPTVLLLSGLGMGAPGWVPVADRLLRAGRRGLRPDPPGPRGGGPPRPPVPPPPPPPPPPAPARGPPPGGARRG